MKILIIHNWYHLRGGEDGVFDAEVRMLRSYGHDVETLEEHSKGISGVLDKALVALNLIFSPRSYFRVKRALRSFNPDIVHVHNFFPLITPAVFFACRNAGIPVVQTLHNFRPICPTGLLLYNNKIEERSLKGSPFWSVKYRVYRNSFIGTFFLASSIYLHRVLGTWKNQVDGFIALTEFQKYKYVEAGWPEAKFYIKPNFVDDVGGDANCHSGDDRSYCIFVGRLSEEKGIDDLLSAWESIKYPLKIVGEGPLEEKVKNCSNPYVEYLGVKSKEDVYHLMRQANLLIMASRWYEGFPLVLLEAYSCATPALVPALGSMQDIVVNLETGAHYRAGSATSLAQIASNLLQNSESLVEMGGRARRAYEEKYTEQKNCQQLLDIYTEVIKRY